jgi:hypothetical protein
MVSKRKIKRGSNNLVEIQTELLKVAIIEDLTDETELEKDVICNYEGKIDFAPDNNESGPAIEEVD